MRNDFIVGPIQLSLKNPPARFGAAPVVTPANQPLAKLTIKGGASPTPAPVLLAVVGSALLGTQQTVRDAVPAEDRMQAFLWRHLVPAQDLPVLVFDPKYQPSPKRMAPARPPPFVGPPHVVQSPRFVGPPSPGGLAKPKFSKQQIVGRLQQLKHLYEEDLLTDAFYDAKVTECEAGQ